MSAKSASTSWCHVYQDSESASSKQKANTKVLASVLDVHLKVLNFNSQDDPCLSFQIRGLDDALMIKLKLL